MESAGPFGFAEMEENTPTKQENERTCTSQSDGADEIDNNTPTTLETNACAGISGLSQSDGIAEISEKQIARIMEQSKHQILDHADKRLLVEMMIRAGWNKEWIQQAILALKAQSTET